MQLVRGNRSGINVPTGIYFLIGVIHSSSSLASLGTRHHQRGTATKGELVTEPGRRCERQLSIHHGVFNEP